MSKLIDFIESSEFCQGIVMQGHFGLPLDIFEIALEEYEKTGKNHLDEYARIIYLNWDAQKTDSYSPCPEMSKKELKEYKKIMENKGFWNVNAILTEEQIIKIWDYLNKWGRYYKKQKTYRAKRHNASQYTNNRVIRNKVFERDGKVCAKCGATDNLTIDHIKPVSKDGKNKLDNLQVLCKSCNSKKGIKEKDYR